MDAPGSLLSEHAGLVEAPVGQVRAVVLAVPVGRFHGAGGPLVLGAPDHQIVVSGGPDVFRAEMAGSALTVEVDRDAGWVQARGQWWWCGRLQVDEHPQGALVRRRTYNCATGPVARLVPFTVGRRHRRDGRRALLHTLDVLGERLGCAARPLPG